MNIAERIFERLNELKMSQTEFSEKTGIKMSTMSEWKKKGTNPSSEKIMPICLALDVSPEWLLSGAERKGRNSSISSTYIIDKDSEMGLLIDAYSDLDHDMRQRLLGYAEALREYNS